MNAFILVGDLRAKENYVLELIKKNSIVTYNIYTFSETLKISEARTIKKTLNLAGGSDGKRLFIIKKSPLPEAQNALLKTLEELSDEAYFVFF